MEETGYCLCCGANVPYHLVESFGRKEFICGYCGFILHVDEFPSVAE
ncbi:MAG: hypothetical protein M1508_09355 [Nitrospirae bacterium]|nr:hypothetical protein [Nitrospirota bacterium]MCL5422975.1 hypothetical protein [Nitrospirota bacterium]